MACQDGIDGSHYVLHHESGVIRLPVGLHTRLHQCPVPLCSEGALFSSIVVVANVGVVRVDIDHALHVGRRVVTHLIVCCHRQGESNGDGCKLK